MSLASELGLKKPFEDLAHEALLNVYFTTSWIKKTAGQFFQAYGLTDVQFNVLVLLKYQCDANAGLTQAELSRMMLVNRPNVTGLVDRLEKMDLVRREAVPGDRRSNRVVLTEVGERKVLEVEDGYYRLVHTVMSPLDTGEQRLLIGLLERVRGPLAGGAVEGADRGERESVSDSGKLPGA